MKELIKKDIMASGIKLSYILVFIGIIYGLFLFMPLDEFLPIASYSLMLFGPLIYFFSIYNYTEHDNYKAELVLPIKRKSIVSARYIEYLSITSLCFLSVILLIKLKEVLGQSKFLDHQMNLIYTGLGVTLIFGSLVLFFVFLLSQKYLKEIGIGSFILTLIPIRAFMEIIKVLSGLENVFDIYNYSKVILSFLLFAGLFYGISCFLSIIIFKRKEF